MQARNGVHYGLQAWVSTREHHSRHEGYPFSEQKCSSHDEGSPLNLTFPIVLHCEHMHGAHTIFFTHL